MGTAQNVKLGPGLLYLAPVGTAEPADLSTPWATVSPLWTPLGYTDAGSTFKYALATSTVDVAEELLPIRNETTGVDVSVAFDAAEITATNLSRALNGGTISTSATLIGTATIVATTDTITSSVAHSLAIGDKVVFGAMTAGAPIVAGTIYYVKTVPTSTTLTISASLGGVVLDITTDGSSASISKSLGVVTFLPPVPGTEVRTALGWESQDHFERWVWRKCLNTGDVTINRKKAPDKSTIPMEFHAEVVTGALPFVSLFADTFK